MFMVEVKLEQIKEDEDWRGIYSGLCRSHLYLNHSNRYEQYQIVMFI